MSRFLPRLRLRFLFCLGCCATTVSLVAWSTSLMFWFFWNTGSTFWSLSRGCLHYSRNSPDSFVGFLWTPKPEQPEFSGFDMIAIPVVWREQNGYYSLSIPLWIPSLLFLAFSAWLYHRAKRRPGLRECGNCGYSLKGNASGVCPECGTPIPDKQKEYKRDILNF